MSITMVGSIYRHIRSTLTNLPLTLVVSRANIIKRWHYSAAHWHWRKAKERDTWHQVVNALLGVRHQEEENIDIRRCDDG